MDPRYEGFFGGGFQAGLFSISFLQETGVNQGKDKLIRKGSFMATGLAGNLQIL
jgi:hypothetical protein